MWNGEAHQKIDLRRVFITEQEERYTAFKTLESVISAYPNKGDETRLLLMPLSIFMTGGKVCVELGVGTGWSASAIVQAVRIMDGELWMFDHTVPSPTPADYPLFNLEKDVRHIKFHRIESIDAGKRWEELSNMDVDWLHIDTSHTYEQTKGELETWYPLVKVGGMIVMHDSKLEGVKRATDEFLSVVKNDVFYFNMLDNYHGVNFIIKLK